MAEVRPSVLVTGGARRIGGAIARRFGEAGWHVVIHYRRSQAEAEALASQLPSAETLTCDLSAGDDAVALVASLADRLPDWRALICSASVFEPDRVTALEPAIFARAIRINAELPARMMQAYFAHARASAGRRAIVLTDQKTANPNPDFFSYTMSKHAIASVVPMLAMAASQPTDRAYALAPGAILPSHDQDEQETEISHRLNLLRRKTDPREIADAALFLAGGALASGQTLFVDSGQHLLAQPRDVIYLAREGVRA